MNADQTNPGLIAPPRTLSDVSYAIVGAAYRVSNVLGVGFSEKIYENALCLELRKRGWSVAQQVTVPVYYEGRVVGEYVPDLLVEGAVIVELKAIDALAKIHRVQCINYLRATGLHLALLLNFGRPRLEVARIALNL